MKSDETAERSPDAAEAANDSRPPSRRQFLKGLTTGTVAIGAVSQAGCGPAVPPLKTLGATDTTTVCPFCGVGCGQVVSVTERQGHQHRGGPRPSRSAKAPCAARARRPSRW